jgi:hypothetical protein
MSRDADRPAQATDTAPVAGSPPEAGAPPSMSTSMGTDTTGANEGSTPGAEAGAESASKPVMWAGVPESNVVPYAPHVPAEVPSLAEADGLSISERMLRLHSPPPPPVEPPPDVVPPGAPHTQPDSIDGRREPRDAATAPDANRAGDAGGDKGVA